MNHQEHVALIRGGIIEQGGTWADFGAGTGSFTRALAELSGPDTTIYAVDQDAGALAMLRASWNSAAMLHIVQADFTQPVQLLVLDGVLMANTLHFVKDQAAALELIIGYLRPGGRLLLVEYDLSQPRFGWVPNPVSFGRFVSLAAEVGLPEPEQVGARRSPSTGITMYAAVAVKTTV